MYTIIPKTNASILDDLYLNDCRITQDQDSHLKKWNWSVYAYDIACIKWKSFKVYTPNYFDVYKIDYIWYDKRLWNFVIIRNGEYKYIYAHTFTDKNVWDKLTKWSILWTIDKSWISQNYHLHIELWKWNNNIRFDNYNITNPKSFDLLMQRWLISSEEKNQKILDFIWLFEWLHFKAYKDFKQFSICYWNKSFEWETSTKEECDKRWRFKIQSIIDRYWLYDLDINKQTAIVSFVYNIWNLSNKQLWLIKQWYWKALANDFKLYNKITVNWNKVIAWWLVKRRQAEFDLLTK